MEILGKMEMLEKRDGHQGRTFLHPKVHLIKIVGFLGKLFCCVFWGLDVHLVF